MPVSARTLSALIAAGVTGDTLVQIVALIDADMAPPKDTTAERRRAYDRERKKRNSGGISTGAEQLAKTSIPPEIPPEFHRNGNSHIYIDSSLDLESAGKSLFPEIPESDKTKRATRIPPDWAPSPLQIQYALKEGLSEQQARREADQFRDYWLARSGQAGRHLDWEATWRRWVRTAADRLPKPRTSDPPSWQ